MPTADLSGTIAITPTTLSAGTAAPRMVFIAGDSSAAGTSAFASGPSTDPTATALTTAGSLIAQIQLDPAREFLGAAGAAMPQAQTAGALLPLPDPTRAGAPSLQPDNGSPTEGIFRPNG